MNLPYRKRVRLQGFDYNTAGIYFITICTADRKCILSTIEGGGVLDAPLLRLKQYGTIAQRVLNEMNQTYEHISIEKYIIMPNHIHLLLHLTTPQINGPSRTPAPANSMIPRYVSTFKRFCNKHYGKNIWQRSYDDRIIRNERMYRKVWEYIDTNPNKWQEDRYYRQNGLIIK